jgi:hypothetical protein
MIDTSPLCIAPSLDWTATARSGDIVSFVFPLAEDGCQDQPKARPCLLLGVHHVGDHRIAEVAYGTTQSVRGPGRLVLRVHHEADMKALGLHRATTFVCSRRIRVSLRHGGFRCSLEGTAVIGHLTPKLMERLEVIRSEIAASAPLHRPRQIPSNAR